MWPFLFKSLLFYFSLSLFFKEDLLSGTKFCFLQIGSQSIPLRQSTSQDQLGWLHSAGGMFELVVMFFSGLEVRSDDDAEQRRLQTHRRRLLGSMGNENREVYRGVLCIT